MRNRRSEIQNALLEVELVEPDTETHPGVVVSRGWARTGSFLVVGVLVGILGTLVLTGRRSGYVKVPNTLLVPPGSASLASPDAPSTTIPVLPVLPFGRASGITLYLTPWGGGAPNEVMAYDIDAGQVHRLALGGDIGWYIRAIDGASGVIVDGGGVVAVANGSARVLDRQQGGSNGAPDAPFGRVARGPDGGVWVRRSDPEEVVLLDGAGAETGRRFSLPAGSDLYGSMGDGRAVVRAGDGEVFVVETDGQRSLLAANVLAPVDAGRFTQVACDSGQHCTLVVHEDGNTYDLGVPKSPDGNVRRIVFQPGGGTTAAIIESGRVSLLDLVSGRLLPDVVDGLVDGLFSDVTPPVQLLPDGAGFVAATSRGLQLLDLAGNMVATVTFPSANPMGPQLLGVGKAKPWNSP